MRRSLMLGSKEITPLHLFHFENSIKDEMLNPVSQYGGVATYGDGKFGKALKNNSSNAEVGLKVESSVSVHNSDYTFECWFYNDGVSSDSTFRVGVGQGTEFGVNFNYSSGKITLLAGKGNSTDWQSILNTQTVIQSGKFVHFAITTTKSVNSRIAINIYLDGILSYNNNSYYIPRNIATEKDLMIFMCKNDSIDEFRVVDRIIYSSNFTPPTKPYKSYAYVKPLNNVYILCNFDNNSVNTINNDTLSSPLTTYGTDKAKFGQAGLINSSNRGTYFNLSKYNLSGDWTIEHWLRHDSAPPANSYQGLWSTANDGQRGVFLRQDGNNGYSLCIGVSVWDYIGSPWTGRTIQSSVQNESTHFAVVKHNDKVSLYIGGVKYGELTIPVSDIIMNKLSLGTAGQFDGTGWNVPPSYIDELRVSNIARYTENFTPPTEPFK